MVVPELLLCLCQLLLEFKADRREIDNLTAVQVKALLMHTGKVVQDNSAATGNSFNTVNRVQSELVFVS